MKEFVISLAVLLLTLTLVTANDIYCLSVCHDITENIASSDTAGAKKALEKFRRNETMFKASVDSSYVTEAAVSLQNLVAAYENNQAYEAVKYTGEANKRMERLKKSLFI